MILINPITGGEVETFTDEATAFLTSRGFKPKLKVEPKPKPKRTTRKSSNKKG